MSPDTVNWFCSYLSRRSQYVRIGSAVSSLLPITHGVPQGAILSPLMFSIYVNDLPQAPQTSDLDSFVDDSKVLLSFLIKDLDQATINLEEDLARVANWCSTNQLLPNPSKTKFILIGTRQLLQRLPKEMSLTFLGEVIKPVTSACDLGVTLDNHLTFDSHITKVVSSCMSKLCQINRVKSSFDHKTLLLIISSLVMSKLLYCSSVWANTSGKNIEKLQKVQNFACRIVCNIQKYDHVSPAIRQLNWLPIKQQLVYKDTVMAYKCLNKLAPPYLCDKFVKRSELHSRQTRNNNQLDIPLFPYFVLPQDKERFTIEQSKYGTAWRMSSGKFSHSDFLKESLKLICTMYEISVAAGNTHGFGEETNTWFLTSEEGECY